MYKKQQEVLRQRSAARKKEANDSFEECLKDNSDEINIEKFLNNLKTLKEQISTNEEASISRFRNHPSQKQARPEATGKVMRGLKGKEPMKSSSFLRPPQSGEKPATSPTNPNGRRGPEPCPREIQKIEKEIEKLVRVERSRSLSSNRMGPKKFDEFYNNIEKRATEAREKIEGKRQQKQAEEMRQATFRPVLNEKPKGQVLPATPDKLIPAIIEKSDRFLLSKNYKLEQKLREKEQTQELEFQKNCTFRPETNDTNSVKRSLTDIIHWTDKLEQKHRTLAAEKEKSLQKQCTFRPKVNPNPLRGSLNSQSQDNFKNIGEKLYSKYKIKESDKQNTKASVSPAKGGPRLKSSLKQIPLAKSVERSLSAAKHVQFQLPDKAPFVQRSSSGLGRELAGAAKQVPRRPALPASKEKSAELASKRQNPEQNLPKQAKAPMSKPIKNAKGEKQSTVPTISRPSKREDKGPSHGLNSLSKDKKVSRKFFNGECVVQNIEDMVSQVTDLEAYFEI